MKKKFIALLGIVGLVSVMVGPSQATAAAIASYSDQMSRLEISVASNHTITFTTPTGVDASSDTITVTFPAGFTMGSVGAGDIDLMDDGVDKSIAASASAGVWGAAVAAQVLTLTAPTDAASGEIAAGSVVTIEIGTNATFGTTGVNQITNPGTAALYGITVGGTFGDDGNIAVQVLSDDQVAITATVDESFSFAISDNTTTFGTLSSGSVATSTPNITLTISTNGASGYEVYIQDEGDGTNPGLYSGSHLIPSSTATLVSGTEGYGVQASSVSATLPVTYDKSGNNVGGLNRAATLYGSNNGPVDTEQITTTHKAAISNTTPAGDYGDTITYTAFGKF